MKTISEIKPQIPTNIIPEAKDFVEKTIAEREKPMGEKWAYGHAARGIATIALRSAEAMESPEEQKRKLRITAQHYISTYGRDIIPYLREELKLALTDEDLTINS